MQTLTALVMFSGHAPNLLETSESVITIEMYLLQVARCAYDLTPASQTGSSYVNS